jgi:hypothetical protein
MAHEVGLTGLSSTDYANHEVPKSADIEAQNNRDRRRQSLASSLVSAKALLEPHEWAAIKVQGSKAFWDEPKDLLITIVRLAALHMVMRFTEVTDAMFLAIVGMLHGFHDTRLELFTIDELRLRTSPITDTC